MISDFRLLLSFYFLVRCGKSKPALESKPGSPIQRLHTFVERRGSGLSASPRPARAFFGFGHPESSAGVGPAEVVEMSVSLCRAFERASQNDGPFVGDHCAPGVGGAVGDPQDS